MPHCGTRTERQDDLMYSFPSGLKSVLLAGAASAIALSAAQAVEAEDAGKRLTNLLAVQQIELTYGSAAMDGEDVVLSEAKAKYPEDDEVVELGDLTLEDVTEEGNGDYRVARLAIDNILRQMDDSTVEIDDLEITGLLLPEDVNANPYSAVLRYDSFDIGSIEVDLGDDDLLLIEDFTSTSALNPDGAIESKAGIDSFTLHLYALDDQEDEDEFVDTLQDLDYDEIYGSLQIDGLWNPTDGRMTLTQFEMVLDDIGTLNVTADLGGYTAALVKELSELMLESEKPDADSSAQSMAALGLMQQLTFHGLGIRFDDDSFTGRMLNHAADQKGVEPEQLIEETRTQIRTQLSTVVGEAFANSTAEAVGNFLDDPRNIEVAARPSAPVPFFMLGAALMGAPETLIKQLGLTITANQ